jgi:TRAP-type C4-dicarboxylate transport system permease small subunit
MAYSDDRHTILSLVGGVIDDLTHLLQTEFRLVKAEVNQKIGRIANGGVMIGAGTALAIGSLVLLLQALVQWLAVAGIPEPWGLLIVGIVVGVIGVAVLMKGARDIKETSLVPNRTLDQIRADFETVKEHVK